MTAVMELVSSPTIPYEVRSVPSDSLAIKLLRDKFYHNYGLDPNKDKPNPGLSWFGVFPKDLSICLLVFAIGVRPDGGVEGTDFYVLPTRDGSKAASWCLDMCTKLIDQGVAPFFYMWVLGKNTSMRRRVEKAFRKDGPRSVLYSYGEL